MRQNSAHVYSVHNSEKLIMVTICTYVFYARLV